jgi:hypothetical protein
MQQEISLTHRLQHTVTQLLNGEEQKKLTTRED